ncbi:MAG: AraC family transcriptional regulator [Xanthomonadales bacterium]|nr:AraC family transcriptional regulator [Xanthomonadales bacterium]
MSVLAPSVGVLWRIIESYKLDPDVFFRDAGLEVEWPIEPGTRVSYEQLDQVRAAAAEATGDPAFGLRAAQVVHPSQIGALGYAWLASSTLRTAMTRMHRFVRVLNDRGTLDLVEEKGHFLAQISVAQASRNRRVRDDAQLAYLVTLCRMNGGPDLNPEFVGFCHAEPEDLRPYEALFRCPVYFSREHNELALSSRDLDRPLPSANHVLAHMNDRIVVQRLAKLDQDDIPNRVRAAIMEQLPCGTISDESVADALHMTSRTMHRKLKQEGESFRTLLKAVRQDLAEQYMADNSLTLTEITFLLGFSEMSSFSRAYKKWNGVSPSAARSGD